MCSIYNNRGRGVYIYIKSISRSICFYLNPKSQYLVSNVNEIMGGALFVFFPVAITPLSMVFRYRSRAHPSCHVAADAGEQSSKQKLLEKKTNGSPQHAETFDQAS